MAEEERDFPGRWSKDEIKLLKKLYAGTPTEKVAKKVGRSLPAVRYRAHLLGLKRQVQQEGRWTPEDIAVLRELYPECPVGEISKRLGRTVNAIANRAHQLGIKRKSYVDKLWTDEQLKLLRQLHPLCENIEDVAKKIGRSPAAVRAKAHDLGLTKHRIDFGDL